MDNKVVELPANLVKTGDVVFHDGRGVSDCTHQQT